MTQLILPSIMAKNQKELDEDLKRLKGVKILHLDVVDGKFAKNKTFQFPFKLSKQFTYNVHLMVNHPEKWVDKYGRMVEVIIFHPEVVDDIAGLIKKIKKKKKKVGLALGPETKVKEVKGYLDKIDYLLVLTVQPGFYHGKFLSSKLRKIRRAKKNNPGLKVIVDGGMNPKTIKKAIRAGADLFVSGSYTTKADDPKQSIKNLKEAIKK